jgi:hypothetical protein
MIHLESERKKHRDGCWRTQAWKNPHDGSKKTPDKAPEKVAGGEGN